MFWKDSYLRMLLLYLSQIEWITITNAFIYQANSLLRMGLRLYGNSVALFIILGQVLSVFSNQIKSDAGCFWQANGRTCEPKDLSLSLSCSDSEKLAIRSIHLSRPDQSDSICEGNYGCSECCDLQNYYTGGDTTAYGCALDVSQDLPDISSYIHSKCDGQTTCKFDLELKDYFDEHEPVCSTLVGYTCLYFSFACYPRHVTIQYKCEESTAESSKDNEENKKDDKSGEGSSNNAGLAAGVTVTIVLLIAAAVALFLFRRKLRGFCVKKEVSHSAGEQTTDGGITQTPTSPQTSQSLTSITGWKNSLFSRKFGRPKMAPSVVELQNDQAPPPATLQAGSVSDRQEVFVPRPQMIPPRPLRPPVGRVVPSRTKPVPKATSSDFYENKTLSTHCGDEDGYIEMLQSSREADPVSCVKDNAAPVYDDIREEY